MHRMTKHPLLAGYFPVPCYSVHVRISSGRVFVFIEVLEKYRDHRGLRTGVRQFFSRADISTTGRLLASKTTPLGGLCRGLSDFFFHNRRAPCCQDMGSRKTTVPHPVAKTPIRYRLVLKHHHSFSKAKYIGMG